MRVTGGPAVAEQPADAPEVSDAFLAHRGGHEQRTPEHDPCGEERARQREERGETAPVVGDAGAGKA